MVKLRQIQKPKILPQFQQKKKIDLYIGTIYPFYPNHVMGFNMEQLQRTTGINPIPLWIKAGIFSHRHPRETPDPEQILIRQLYLNKVPDGEWLLVLDSDEIILGGLEMIAPVLELANNDENRVDVICISEILPDMTIINRPRFIKKREGLKYGGPDKKHDYIEYHQHVPFGYTMSIDPAHNPEHRPTPLLNRNDRCTSACGDKSNYINPKADNPYMWTMEGVFFWHNKNGALKIYRDDDDGKEMKAFNLISVKQKNMQGGHPQAGCSQYEGGGWTHDVKCELETMPLINETEQERMDRYNMYKDITRD